MTVGGPRAPHPCTAWGGRASGPSALPLLFLRQEAGRLAAAAACLIQKTVLKPQHFLHLSFTTSLGL